MSLKRNTSAGVIVIAVLLMILAGVIYYFMPHNRPELTMRLGDGVFKTWVVNADTKSDDQTNPIAKIPKLGMANALLIKYPDSDRWPIYMKGADEPMDIVWLNGKKEVVSIVKNVQLDSYPYKAYEPTKKAQYAVEFRAGTVDKKAISTSRSATFELEDGQGGILP